MKDKVNLVIVTGATSGIGLAIAKRLHSEYQLLLIGRNKKKLQTIKPLFKTGRAVFFMTADFLHDAEIKAIFSNQDIPWTDLYGLVNCAGTSIGDSILHISEEDWKTSIQVNLTAPFLLTKYYLDKKVDKTNKNTSGSIVNISSMMGLTGSRKPNYGAAKAGLISLTKSTALITSELGIRVNAICPGAVDTPMTAGWDKKKINTIINNTPLKRIAAPEEIAAIVHWLLSEEASYMTGSIINATGGQYLGN